MNPMRPLLTAMVLLLAACLPGREEATLPLESGPALSQTEFEALADDLAREHRLAHAPQPARPDDAEEEEEDEGAPPAERASWWLRTRSLATPYPHVDYFRKAGIRRYEGPATCLTCHREMILAEGDESRREVATLDDLAASGHFRHLWRQPGGEELARGAATESDCLVCHSRNYDMTLRQPEERGGKRFLGQDRTLRAALTVARPDAAACLRCHGGAGEQALPGWDREEDLHARAGLICTDCHIPVGHRLPGGQRGVAAPAGDLPDRPVACDGCHTRTPHVSSEDKALFNGHAARLWCESCHRAKLPAGSALLRDQKGGEPLAGHGLRAEGPACVKCHGRQGGLIDFEGLGYPPDRIRRLRDLPEL